MRATSAGVKINGVEIRPLTLKQVEEIENWMRERLAEATKDTIAKAPEAMGVLLEKLAEVSFFSKYASKMLITVVGQVKCLELCSDFDSEQAYEWLKTIENRNEFNRQFLELNKPRSNQPTGEAQAESQ